MCRHKSVIGFRAQPHERRTRVVPEIDTESPAVYRLLRVERSDYRQIRQQNATEQLGKFNC